MVLASGTQHLSPALSFSTSFQSSISRGSSASSSPSTSSALRSDRPCSASYSRREAAMGRRCSCASPCRRWRRSSLSRLSQGDARRWRPCSLSVGADIWLMQRSVVTGISVKTPEPGVKGCAPALAMQPARPYQARSKTGTGRSWSAEPVRGYSFRALAGAGLSHDRQARFLYSPASTQ